MSPSRGAATLLRSVYLRQRLLHSSLGRKYSADATAALAVGSGTNSSQDSSLASSVISTRTSELRRSARQARKIPTLVSRDSDGPSSSTSTRKKPWPADTNLAIERLGDHRAQLQHPQTYNFTIHHYLCILWQRLYDMNSSKRGNVGSVIRSLAVRMELRELATNTSLSKVDKLLKALIQLARNTSDDTIKSDQLSCVALARLIGITALFFRRRGFVTPQMRAVYVDAGSQMVRLVSLEDDLTQQQVSLKALHGQGLALQGDVTAATASLSAILQLVRLDIEVAASGPRGLDPEAQDYFPDMARLLQAINEQQIEDTLRPTSPSQLEQSREPEIGRDAARFGMLKLRRSLERMHVDPEAAQRGSDVREVLKTLFTETAIVLPFAVFHFPDTETTFDDLVTVLRKKDVHELTSTILSNQDGPMRRQAILALCLSLLRRDRFEEALMVFKAAEKEGDELPERLIRSLLRHASSGRSPRAIDALLETLESRQSRHSSPSTRHLSAATWLTLAGHLARNGEVGKLQTLWKRIVAENPHLAESDAFTAQLLVAYAHSKTTSQATFEDHLQKNYILPHRPGLTSGKRPFTIQTYHTVIHAYVRWFKFRQAHRFLADMEASRIPVDATACNILLTGYLHSSNVAAAGRLWTRMNSVGPAPNSTSYQLIALLFLKRNDLASTFAVVREQEMQGYPPSTEVINHLLKRLVSLGEYDRARRLYNVLAEHPTVQPGVSAYNQMLAILIYEGAPFPKVLSAFREMQEQGMVPTHKSYALVMQSACEADRMSAAEHLFTELDSIGRPEYISEPSQTTSELMEQLDEEGYEGGWEQLDEGRDREYDQEQFDEGRGREDGQEFDEGRDGEDDQEPFDEGRDRKYDQEQFDEGRDREYDQEEAPGGQVLRKKPAKRPIQVLPGLSFSRFRNRPQYARADHFSILIHAHLRLGNVSAAKEYFDELQDRGTAVPDETWAVLVRSYVDSGTEANMRLARNIILQRLEEDEQDNSNPLLSSLANSSEEEQSKPAKKGRGRPRKNLPFKRSAPEILYSPLLVSEVQKGNLENAEAVFDELRAKGIDMSLTTLFIALDCYRQVGDIDTMFLIWEEVFAKATTIPGKPRMPKSFEKAFSKELAPIPTGVSAKAQDIARRRRRAAFEEEASKRLASIRSPEVQRNALVIPLSIMLDALADAERHEDIADIWTRVRSAGFSFDPYNWNQLLRMLAQTGRMEDVLKVLEKILTQLPPKSERGLLLQKEQAERRERIRQRNQGKARRLRGEEEQADDQIDSPARPSLRATVKELSRKGPYKPLFDPTSPLFSYEDENAQVNSDLLGGQGQNELYSLFETGAAYTQNNSTTPPPRNILEDLEDDEDAEYIEDEDDETSDRIPVLRALREQDKINIDRPFWRAQRATMEEVEGCIERYQVLCREEAQQEQQDEDSSRPPLTPIRELLKRYPRAAEIIDSHFKRGQAYAASDAIRVSGFQRRFAGRM